MPFLLHLFTAWFAMKFVKLHSMLVLLLDSFGTFFEDNLLAGAMITGFFFLLIPVHHFCLDQHLKYAYESIISTLTFFHLLLPPPSYRDVEASLGLFWVRSQPVRHKRRSWNSWSLRIRCRWLWLPFRWILWPECRCFLRQERRRTFLELCRKWQKDSIHWIACE